MIVLIVLIVLSWLCCCWFDINALMCGLSVGVWMMCGCSELFVVAVFVNPSAAVV